MNKHQANPHSNSAENKGVFNRTNLTPAGQNEISVEEAISLSKQENQRQIEKHRPKGSTAEELRNAYNPLKTTDLGNAERLEALAEADLKFVPGIGWLFYDSGVWRADGYAATEIYKKKVIDALYKELEPLIGIHDTENIKKLTNWAKRSEELKKADGALGMAKSSPAFYTLPDKLDSDQMLLNVKNGTIDLKTGRLKAHDRKDLITKITPVNYDPKAKAPVFENFLLQIMGGDKELVSFIQRAVGYSLTGSVKEQCWFICYGVGANGKSTLLDSLYKILGDYGMPAAPDLLMLPRGGGEKHPTEQADLMGKRFVVAQETESGRQLAEVTVKRLTGDALIKARFMRGDFFKFCATHKLWLATNHKPVIKDTTESTWRRIILIPFEVVIPAAERDKDLPEKLVREFPGILAWAVAGCLEWQKSGLQIPARVRAAVNEYQEESDVIGRFLKERTLKDAGNSEYLDKIFKSYQTWCGENNQGATSSRGLSQALQERGLQKVKKECGAAFLGIRLMP